MKGLEERQGGRFGESLSTAVSQMPRDIDGSGTAADAVGEKRKVAVVAGLVFRGAEGLAKFFFLTEPALHENIEVVVDFGLGVGRREEDGASGAAIFEFREGRRWAERRRERL